jgi:hypothetical protein
MEILLRVLKKRLAGGLCPDGAGYCRPFFKNDSYEKLAPSRTLQMFREEPTIPYYQQIKPGRCSALACLPSADWPIRPSQ